MIIRLLLLCFTSTLVLIPKCLAWTSTMSSEPATYAHLFDKEQRFAQAHPNLLKTFFIGTWAQNRNSSFSPTTQEVLIPQSFKLDTELIDFNKGTIKKFWPSKTSSTLLSPDGSKKLLFNHTRLHLYAPQKQPLHITPFEQSSELFITATRFSPDGTILFVGNNKGTIIAFDSSSGKELFSLPPTGNFSGPITSIACSVDNTKIASGNKDGALKISDLELNKNITFGSHGAPIGALMFSPQGSLVATSYSGTIKLFDAATIGPRMKSLFTIKAAHQEPITSIAFDSTGRKMVTGSLDKTAIVWDAQTGEKIASVEDTKPIKEVFFNPYTDQQIYTLTTTTIKQWELP